MISGDVAFDERVAAHYEAWYETLEGQRADGLEKGVLCWLLPGFPRAGSVLEVGCGTGHFSRWLRCHGLATVGLDLSPAMLAEARVLDGVPLMHSLSVTDGKSRIDRTVDKQVVWVDTISAQRNTA